MNSPPPPTSYDFNVNLPAGTQLQPNDTGGVDVIQPTENGVAITVGQFDTPWAKDNNGKTLKTSYKVSGNTITVGQFGAPWAKDNNGKTLKTSYKVSGNTITQTVDPNTAQYPITADPKFTWGWVSGTAYLDRGETRTVSTSLGEAALVCSAIMVGSPPGGATCVVIALQMEVQARTANSRNQCVKLKLAGLPPFYQYAGTYIYSGGHCK